MSIKILTAFELTDISIIGTANTTRINIEGNCLEGAGVPDGSQLVMAMDINPQMGEITSFTDQSGKEFVKILNCHTADGYILHTKYKDGKNKTFCVPEVKGVAIACIHNGVLLWKNNIDIKQRLERDEYRRKNPSEPSNIGGFRPIGL